MRSVDWSILGVVIMGLLMVVAFVLANILLFGIAVGWWAGGLFWTYWITYHSKKEGST